MPTNSIRIVPVNRVRKTAPVPPPALHAYTVEKFMALQHYTSTTSPWRVAAVMITTPFWGLLGAIIPALVPLQDPLAGVMKNPGFLINVFIISSAVTLGAMTHWRAGAKIPSHIYCMHHSLGVSAATGLQQVLVITFLGTIWRFPIPMSWIVASTTFGVCVGLSHLIVFGRRLWKEAILLDSARRYIPALAFQAGQIVVYPVFSVLFDYVSPIYQVLLTLLFPIVKYMMKLCLRRLTAELDEYSTEVAVTGIEICAALYQSMIMQNVPSKAATAIIMGLDAVQGLLAVKFFMDRRTSGRKDAIIATAWDELSEKGSAEGSTSAHKDVVRRGPEQASRELGDSTSKSNAVIIQALQLADAAESILLVEYLEVAVPVVNAAFITVACQFESARYNTRLRGLWNNPEALKQAVATILVYSVLQAVSFFAMHLVMRYRFRFSAVYHLAFILEYHRISIVGKMIGWLPIILHFTGIHYGVDFSFRFDYAAMLQKGTNETSI